MNKRSKTCLEDYTVYPNAQSFTFWDEHMLGILTGGYRDVGNPHRGYRDVGLNMSGRRARNCLPSIQTHGRCPDNTTSLGAGWITDKLTPLIYDIKRTANKIAPGRVKEFYQIRNQLFSIRNPLWREPVMCSRMDGLKRLRRHQRWAGNKELYGVVLGGADPLCVVVWRGGRGVGGGRSALWRHGGARWLAREG